MLNMTLIALSPLVPTFRSVPHPHLTTISSRTPYVTPSTHICSFPSNAHDESGRSSYPPAYPCRKWRSHSWRPIAAAAAAFTATARPLPWRTAPTARIGPCSAARTIRRRTWRVRSARTPAFPTASGNAIPTAATAAARARVHQHPSSWTTWPALPRARPERLRWQPECSSAAIHDPSSGTTAAAATASASPAAAPPPASTTTDGRRWTCSSCRWWSWWKPRGFATAIVDAGAELDGCADCCAAC